MMTYHAAEERKKETSNSTGWSRTSIIESSVLYVSIYMNIYIYIYLSIESRQLSTATDHDLQKKKEREQNVNACSISFFLSRVMFLFDLCYL
jgi:hypothetical protein